MRLSYNKIYLCSLYSTHGEHRVTRRTSSRVPPKTIQFAGNRVGPDGEPMGTLVLDEKIWNEWFGNVPKDEFLPGMSTAHDAAETLVNSQSRISYGCPLCVKQFDSLEKAQKHTEEEMKMLLEGFEVIMEYECPVCGKTYIQAKSYYNHLIGHAEEELNGKK